MKLPIIHKTKGTFDMFIDEEDYEKIKHLNLTLNHSSNKHTKYCKSIVYKNCKYIKTLNIHRVIMGLGDFKEDKRIINHIDGNGLNNRKENLEICSQMYNAQSFRKVNCNIGWINYEKNTEKTKRKKQWCFQITVNKKRHRKRFLTEEEAIEYKNEYIKLLQ